jgi:hypothetical protein
MELYLHTAGSEDPELIDREPTSTVGALVLTEAGEEPELVWLQEHEEPLDAELTLEQADIGHRGHVHRGRCRHVEVRVRYGGVDHERSFVPSATIKRIFDWATGPDAFDLTPEQRLKHVLALPSADHFLAWTVHVGSVVEHGTCTSVLELAPRERFEG